MVKATAASKEKKVELRGLRQNFGEVRENPIKLDKKRVQRIVDVLNTDLATEYVLYHQYKKHHWLVTGPEQRELKTFFQEMAQSELLDADALAERIIVLGGIPVATPSNFEKYAYLQSEPEGLYDLRTMLENDLKGEQALIIRLRQHIELARGLGDHGTEELLEEILVGEERHAHEVANLLGGESLTHYIKRNEST